MSKQIKKYCVVGKIVCDLVAASLFVLLPILASGIAEYLTKMIIGG